MVLAMTMSAGAVSQDEASCNRNHGPNAFCPMHRHTKPSSPSDSSSHESRWCNGNGGGLDAVLTALLGFGGPVVSRQRLGETHWHFGSIRDRFSALRRTEPAASFSSPS